MEQIPAESISSLKAGGLRVLWQGPSPQVDVVAVHGLGANPDWAWVRKVGNRDNKRKRDETPSLKLVNWLSDPDMLPSKLPNARIMTFNYLSKWHANAPVQRLALCAEQLLNALDDLRKEESGTNLRPLIFVGHSFGGIVIEQMIVYANSDDHFQHISAATAGVMFLGSPFRGSNATEWAQMIAWTGQKIGLGSSDAILKDLQEDSVTLLDLRHQFCKSLLQRPFPVQCFFEQYSTNYGRRWGFTTSTLVVDENSACLDGHKKQSLPTDHLKLNKFKGPNDQAYLDVSFILVKWVREKLELTKAQHRTLSKDENECLQDLFLTDPQDDLAAIKRRAQRVTGTCEWILTREEFRKWLAGETRLLYLTGDPGIGKTTIAARLTEELVEKASQDDQITLAYYFCDNKDQNRRTASTVLRGLLLQMLRQRPALFELFLPEYKQKGKKWFDSFDGLHRMFCGMLKDSSARKVYILVDALDECEETHRDDLLRCFEDITSTSQVIVTSRMSVGIEEMELKSQKENLATHCPSFYSRFIHVDSTAINEDLRNFIEAKMGELPARFSAKTKDMIKEALIDRAGGTFIWVSLVLMDISKAKRSDAASQKLHKLPRDLNEVYVRILRDIDEEDVGDARFFLQCVTAALRPLTVQELSTARMIGRGHWNEDHAPRPEDILEYEDGWKCCGPVLRLDSDGENRTVNLIHQSAKDFLLGNNIGYCGKMKELFFEKSTADLTMFNACRDFLTKSDFDIIATRMYPHWTHCQRYELECLSLSTMEQPFLSYCLEHWGDHAIAAEHQLLKNLPCIEEWAPKRLDMLVSWLLRAIKHDQQQIVRRLLSKGADINYYCEYAGTALHVALSNSHKEMAQLLMEHPDIHITEQLEIATSYGEVSIVALLLASQKCDVNHMASSLLVAAQKGSGPIVELLLAQPDVNADLVDDHNRAPLSYACEVGSQVIVKLLLSREGVMAERRDRDGRTPLSWAVGSGQEACVQLLLSRDDVLADSMDNSGRTPLSWAVSSGQESCVQLLLSRDDVLADSMDNSGRTPLTWAAISGRESCVQLLISRVSADHCDGHGLTPLLHAAIHGCASTIQLLLSRTDVLVDRRDGDGHNALMLAAQSGHEPCMRVLLTHNDISLQARDQDGRTALSWAVERRNPDDEAHSCAKLLLSKDCSLTETCDNKMWTPLHFAASSPHNSRVVKFLTEQPHITIDPENDDGRTPLALTFHGVLFVWTDNTYLLVDAGANVSHHSVTAAIREVQDKHKNLTPNFDRIEPWDLRFYIEWPKLLQYLVERGAKI